ncbi:MAG: transposase [Alphaproteobacteria bacterium]|nr:transposase [Alphaproteobacteria bacterium]
MRRSKFAESEIINILRQQEAGDKTVDICRRYGISPATFFNWKAKYGGLDVRGVQRLRRLEEENKNLKKLLAESILENVKLRENLSRSS